MTRKITVHIHEHETTRKGASPEQYADLANAIWMLMRTTPFDFEIEADRSADLESMDQAWAQYGDDASWNE